MAYRLSTEKTWLETRAELATEFQRWGVREWEAECLGRVRPDAAPEAIDDMFRIKAKRLHPDAGGSDDAMKELNEAYARVKNGRAAAAS